MKFARKLIHGGGDQCTLTVNLWGPYSSAWFYLNACWTDGSICMDKHSSKLAQAECKERRSFELVTLTFDLDFQGQSRYHPGRPLTQI